MSYILYKTKQVLSVYKPPQCSGGLVLVLRFLLAQVSSNKVLILGVTAYIGTGV